MTEYETAALFYQIVEAAHSAMANYLTVVFAVVVVSYFVGGKLDRSASIMLITLYSLFCFGMIREIYFLYSDLVRLGWEMANYAGHSYDWHGMSNSLTDGPPWIIPVSALSMCVLGYIGSIIFLYSIRKKERTADY